MANFCDGAIQQELYHVEGKKQRRRIREMNADRREHYLFLYASQKNCLQCLQAWLARGKDVNKGTEHFPDWDALAWAEEASMGFDT